MRNFINRLSIPVLLSFIGLTIIAYYITKNYYYPSIPPPVKVDSGFLKDAKPQAVINIDSCNFYVVKSLEEYRAGDFEKSLAAAEKAVAFNSLSEFAENNKCSALIALGRLEEALIACERATYLSPKFQNAIGNTNYIKQQLEKQKVVR